MRMRIRGHQTMVTETSKTIDLWGRFVYNMDNSPIHRLTIFYWQVFCTGLKQPPY